MASTPAKIRSLPGVKRDGTRYDSDYFQDAQWCRFQRGLPRKMGGFMSVARDLPQPVYGINSFASGGKQYVHLGSHGLLSQRVFSDLGAVLSANDRTPGGFIDDAGNIWSMDVFWDTNLGNVLVALVAPNMNISSALFGAPNPTNIFVGPVTDPGALTASGQDPISGGVIAVGNYLVSYGSDGLVQWSAESNIMLPTLASANVTAQKIVTARRVRGGGVPAALLWSLDSLLQMTFNDPATNLWNFDTLSEESSILSSRAVIEYDGVFYWPGVDRFLSYNGVVREVTNDMNSNYFFDNLNFSQRQKIFAYKVPRFSEIWWCYPRGNATECTHAIVYNVRGGFWFDTQLPDLGRTDGLYPKTFFKPLMAGVQQTLDGYDLWQHETGADRVRLASTTAIQSYFETQEFNMMEIAQQDAAISIDIVEPDFVQSGNLTLTLRGRANARAPIIDDLPKNAQIITPVAANSDQQIARFKTEFRLLSFRFESNEAGGTYQAGETLAHMQAGDRKITQ